MKIQTTTTVQTGSEILGTKDRNLYYLVIENANGKKMIINVGEKTHKQVQELVNDEHKLADEKKEELANRELTAGEKLTLIENQRQLEQQTNNNKKLKHG